jgi:KDO2-lipid IV(A) lauroyltransferase
VIYHIIGYRKKVVMSNLLTAFPDKPEKERIKIMEEMYHQLIDTFLETIKFISISEKEINKRFKCNREVVNDLYESGKNVQMHGGHFFNWEFMNLAYCLNLKYAFIGVYQPLTNKIFNKIMQDMRTRFGTHLISASNFNREFIKVSKGRYALALVADQNSSNMHNAYWLPFFGKMAPFVTGPERTAVATDSAIVFATIYRTKRGYYQSDFSLYTTEPKSLRKGEITIALRDFLEEQIKLRPSSYLWTHKRWKHHYDAEKYKEMTLEEV